jgi:hypothetical protein
VISLIILGLERGVLRGASLGFYRSIASLNRIFRLNYSFISKV